MRGWSACSTPKLLSIRTLAILSTVLSVLDWYSSPGSVAACWSLDPLLCMVAGMNPPWNTSLKLFSAHKPWTPYPSPLSSPYDSVIIIIIINLTLWRTLQNVIQTQKCVPNQKKTSSEQVCFQVFSESLRTNRQIPESNWQFVPKFRTSHSKRPWTPHSCVPAQRDYLELHGGSHHSVISDKLEIFLFCWECSANTGTAVNMCPPPPSVNQHINPTKSWINLLICWIQHLSWFFWNGIYTVCVNIRLENLGFVEYNTQYNTACL